MMQQRAKESPARSALKTALTGSVSGALIGAGTKLFAKESPTIAQLLKSAALGGILAGGAAGGAGYVGSEVEGAPQPNESHPYLKRGLIGGALLGGGAGALLGGLGAAGHLDGLPKVGPAMLRQFLATAKNELPLDNMLTRKIMSYGKSPSVLGTLKGAGLGALAAGIPTTYLASDEGNMYDQLNNNQKDRIRRSYG